MNIIIKAVESLGFRDNRHHVYIEMCTNEGDFTKDFFNESFEIASFLNINLEEYIERHKSFMAKLGHTNYTFTSMDENKLDDIEFIVGIDMTKDMLIQIREAFKEEFIEELTMVALT